MEEDWQRDLEHWLEPYLQALGNKTRRRMSDDLKLGAGVIYLDPSIQNVSPGNEDLRGNVPTGISKWQLTGHAEYHVAAIPGLSLHGNVRHTGKAPTSDSNSLYIPAYTTASAGLQFDTLVGARKASFTGNVNNLFNAKYWTQTNIGEGINATMSVRPSW